MTNSFTTARLVNNRVMVRGTDKFGVDGECIVDSSQWDEINAHSEFDQAEAAFAAAVEDFFRPLEEAAEKMEKALSRPTDSISYVVLHEATEGTDAQPEQIIKLTRDSIILRLLEVNDFDRLVWVDGELEILAVEDVPEPDLQDTVDTLRNAGFSDVADLVSGDAGQVEHEADGREGSEG